MMIFEVFWLFWLVLGYRASSFGEKVSYKHSYRTIRSCFCICFELVSDFYQRNKIFHRAIFQIFSIENTDFSKKVDF